MARSNHVYPDFKEILGRTEKEKLLGQHAYVIWLTGLSGAGKTTLARHFELELSKRGYLTQVLDGDNMRTGLNNNLGFSPTDRLENIRRIAEVSKLFVNCGIICINSFISPTKEIRDMARNIIGDNDFIEVYVNASLATCEKRDTKGLYKLAREGKIKNFTGIDAPFEPPEKPNIEIVTGRLSVADSVRVGLDYILPLISFKNT